MRCFIGVPVPRALAARLAAQPAPPEASPAPEANLHLTLAFLGNREADWLEALFRTLDGAFRCCEPFSIPLATLAAFPDANGTVWAAHGQMNEPLRTLHRRLWSHLEAHGVAPDERGFAPHVTLARGTAPLRQSPQPGPWVLPVDRVLCYESPPGGRYRTLREWPLVTRAEG